jgi:hypothetical protein
MYNMKHSEIVIIIYWVRHSPAREIEEKVVEIAKIHIIKWWLTQLKVQAVKSKEGKRIRLTLLTIKRGFKSKLSDSKIHGLVTSHKWTDIFHLRQYFIAKQLILFHNY